jgi:hypothetical protein
MSRFKLNPAAVSTFGSTNLTDAVSFSYNETGTTETLGTDGKPYIIYSQTGDIMHSCTVEGVDPEVNVSVGSTGTLTLRAIAQENGGSAVTANALVFTFANANVTDVSKTINHLASSTNTISFNCYSSNGTTSPVVIS